MKRACLIWLLACGPVGCASVSEKAEDITTISLGADDLQKVQIDQSVMLGDTPMLPACLPIQLTLAQQNATVALKPSADGCALTLSQPGMVLIDKDSIKRARDQAGPFDVDGIRSGSVELMKLDLKTGDGKELPLAQYVDAVTVQIDGDTLLDKMAADKLQNDTPKAKLPDPLIEKLKSAVKSDQPATADVVITLWLHGVTIPQLPTALQLSAVLQPELQVSLLKAL